MCRMACCFHFHPHIITLAQARQRSRISIVVPLLLISILFDTSINIILSRHCGIWGRQVWGDRPRQHWARLLILSCVGVLRYIRTESQPSVLECWCLQIKYSACFTMLSALPLLWESYGLLVTSWKPHTLSQSQQTLEPGSDTYFQSHETEDAMPGKIVLQFVDDSTWPSVLHQAV